MILTAIQDFGDSTPLPIYRTLFMYASHIRYGLEALIVAMYGFNRSRLPCPVEEVYCHFSSPKEIFRIIGRNFIIILEPIVLNDSIHFKSCYICVSHLYLIYINDFLYFIY